MGEYKKQHTITASYLKGFAANATPNTLWRYVKRDGTSERCNIERATVKFYAYSFQDKDGQWNHSVEKVWGIIEAKAIPLLPNLAAGSMLSPEDKYHLALFIGSIVRRPAALLDHFQKAILQYANDREKKLALIENLMPKLKQQFSDAEIEGVREKARSGEFDLSVDLAKAAQLQTWLRLLPRYAQIVADMNWQLWRTDRRHPFITSDAPAFARRNGHYDDPNIVGIARHDLKAELHFPVSQTCFLVAKHEFCKYANSASKTRVDELNKLTIRMAHSHVFAQSDSERLRRLVVQNSDFIAPLPDFGPVEEEIDRKYLGKPGTSDRTSADFTN